MSEENIEIICKLFEESKIKISKQEKEISDLKKQLKQENREMVERIRNEIEGNLNSFSESQLNVVRKILSDELKEV